MTHNLKTSRLCAVLAAALVAFAGSAFAQDIKFGFNADQSGTAAAELGMAARHGFELAIEDINKSGGSARQKGHPRGTRRHRDPT